MSTPVRCALACFLVAAVAPACNGSGCPKPSATPSEHAEWEAVLAKKAVLTLDPTGSIAIKRDVHNQVVSLDAKPFADALNAVLMDPQRRFGLIEVDRTRAAVGKPYTVGERFQGRYSLEGALEQALGNDIKTLFDSLDRSPAFAEAICEIENKQLSDYGVVTELVMTPPDAKEFRFSYRYLSGSPIAGSSTYVVTQLDPGKSRVTEIFEYQERSRAFADFFATSGLKLHLQVVESQITQAVIVGGGRVLETDIHHPAPPPPAAPPAPAK
jgi:hypothetical protein